MDKLHETREPMAFRVSGLTEKVDMINRAIDLLHQAQELLDQAALISVVISLGDEAQGSGSEPRQP